MCVLRHRPRRFCANRSRSALLVATALLLQVRFGDPIDKNQEALDDAIDSTPALLFWLQWTFVPWWPIKLAAGSNFRDANTYLDDIFLLCSWIGTALDVIMFLSVSSISDAVIGGGSTVHVQNVSFASPRSLLGT